MKKFCKHNLLLPLAFKKQLASLRYFCDRGWDGLELDFISDLMMSDLGIVYFETNEKQSNTYMNDLYLERITFPINDSRFPIQVIYKIDNRK